MFTYLKEYFWFVEKLTRVEQQLIPQTWSQGGVTVTGSLQSTTSGLQPRPSTTNSNQF